MSSAWRAIALLLLLLVSPQHALAQKCKTVTHDKLVKCATELDTDAIEERSIVVRKPSNYSLECQAECIRRNNILNKPCTAFIFRDKTDYEQEKRNTCIFFACVTQLTAAPKSSGVSVVMQPNCFATPEPTNQPSVSPTSSAPSLAPTTSSPTTGAPTQSPSKPTKRPTAVPTRRTLAPETARPSRAPRVRTEKPTRVTARPSQWPTKRPTRPPTLRPTDAPTTLLPSLAPTTGTPTSSPLTEEEFLIKFPPSRQPTSLKPTLRPTFPTQRPSFRATASPDPRIYRSPSGIPPEEPFVRELFRDEFVPNAATCMIVRRAFGTPSIEYENFIGTEDDCMKECQYTQNCAGVLYSPSLQTCTLLATMEMTDSEQQAQYFARHYRVFVLRTTSIKYYNSYCALWMAQRPCNTDDLYGQCQWNTGERGYNQNRFTDTGYCGRVKCIAAQEQQE